MDQELIKPQSAPRTSSQAFSPLGCFLAAAGVTLSTFCLLGAAAAASAWAVSSLLGLSNSLMLGLVGLSLLPVLFATVWTGARAWHVERRLAQGLDIDTPVFKIGHYLKPR